MNDIFKNKSVKLKTRGRFVNLYLKGDLHELLKKQASLEKKDITAFCLSILKKHASNSQPIPIERLVSAARGVPKNKSFLDKFTDWLKG